MRILCCAVCSVFLLSASPTSTVFWRGCLEHPRRRRHPCAGVWHMHLLQTSGFQPFRTCFSQNQPRLPTSGFLHCGHGLRAPQGCSSKIRSPQPRAGAHSVVQSPTLSGELGSHSPGPACRRCFWTHVLHSDSERHLFLVSRPPLAFRFCTNLQFLVIFYLSFLHA